jgi:hypothetical protein
MLHMGGQYKMKGHSAALLGIIIILSLYIPTSIDQSKKIDAENLKVRYNRIIETAAQDATYSLVDPKAQISQEILSEGEGGNYKTIDLNLDKALWRFYETLYMNMNIENNGVSKAMLREYIPLKLAVGYNGFYINVLTEVTSASTGRKEIREVWNPIKTYAYYDEKNKIGIEFTLDNYVKIYDTNTKKIIEGTAEEMRLVYPNSIFNKDFDFTRRRIITELISRDLSHFTEVTNNIAKKQGWGYLFKVPYIDNRAINDISFIAFLQGLPITGLKDFNTFGFGVSQIINSKKYYGNLVSGVKVYHKKGCIDLTDEPILFNNKMDAAKQGYYPCPKCF